MVAANGSVLGYSATKIIERAHDAVKEVCDREAHVSMKTTRNGGQLWGPMRHMLLLELREGARFVRETAEKAKAIIDLFGSHSYRATLGCHPNPA